MNAAITDVGRVDVGVRGVDASKSLTTRRGVMGIAALYPSYALKNAGDFG